MTTAKTIAELVVVGCTRRTKLAESSDSASGFQKRADQESAYPTTRIGSPEEGLDLLAREPLDATLLALRGSQTDPLSSFRDQMLGLVVGVAAVSEKLRQAADIPGSIPCFSLFPIVPRNYMRYDAENNLDPTL